MKNKILIILASIVIVLVTMTSALAFSGSGSGTVGSPYLITNSSQVDEIHDNLTAHYRLSNDIDMSGYTYLPLNAGENDFSGSLDGNGFSIDNLEIMQQIGFGGSPNYDYTSFLNLQDAQVYDLTINNFSVTANGTGFESFFIGFFGSVNNSNISDISFQGSLSTVSDWAVQHIGFTSIDYANNIYENIFVNISTTIDLSSSTHGWDAITGGLIATVNNLPLVNDTPLLIKNVTTVVDTSFVNVPTISNAGSHAGLIARSNGNVTIVNSSTSGSILTRNASGVGIGSYQVSGIGNFEDYVTIIDTYSTLNIDTDGYSFGLGYFSPSTIIDVNVENFYYAGSISGSPNENFTIGNINNSLYTASTNGVYYDYEVTGSNTTGCDGVTCTGYNSYEMSIPSNFPTFDFVNTWKIGGYVTYPVHVWNDYIKPVITYPVSEGWSTTTIYNWLGGTNPKKITRAGSIEGSFYNSGALRGVTTDRYYNINNDDPSACTTYTGGSIAVSPANNFNFCLYTQDSTSTSDGSNTFGVITDYNGATSISLALKYENIKPSVNTINISEGSGEVLANFRGRDLDDANITYYYEWKVNGTSVLNGTIVDQPENTYTSLVSLNDSNYVGGDTVSISVTSSDGFYNSTTDTAQVFTQLQVAPVILETSITSVATAIDDVQSNVKASDVNGDNITYYYDWYVNDVVVSSGTISNQIQNTTTNNITLLSGNFVKGDEVLVSYIASDGILNSSSVNTTTLTISNTPPVMQETNIDSVVTTNQNIESNARASDIDNDLLTYYYDWYVNDIIVSSGSVSGQTQNILINNISLDSTNYIKGDDVLVQYTVFDGETNISSVNTSTTTIINTAPVLNNISLETVREYETLIAIVNANDDDSDTIIYYYDWYVNDVLYTSGNTTSNSVGLINTAFNGNDNVTFRVFISDGVVNTSSINNTATILPYADVFITPTLGTIGVNEISYTWTDNASSVQLYRNDVLVTTTTGNSYTFTGLAEFTSYTFKFRPFDGIIRGADVTDTRTTLSAEEDNNAPVMQNITFSPTVLRTDNNLEGFCEATDIDDASVQYYYEWFINDVSFSSGNTITVDSNNPQSIGSIGSGNFSYQDNITLSCYAYDGLAFSNTINNTITVSNTAPVISEYRIFDNTTEYVANYSYFDADNQTEVVISYEWYKNGAILGVNSKNISSSLFNVSDNIISQVTTGDGIVNITINSSLFLVGDNEPPVIGTVDIPEGVIVGRVEYLSAVCTDNVGVADGYPKIAWTNPNLVEQEFTLFREDDTDTFGRFYSFNTVGEYTDISIICTDGNSNTVRELNTTIVAVIETGTTVVVGTGSSGGGNTIIEVEPFRNITSFNVIPETQFISIGVGETRIIEFEVQNNDIVDFTVTSTILVGNVTPQTYNWMNFDNGEKRTSFELETESGITSGSKFVRYVITVPDGTPFGDYQGAIEVEGLGQSGIYIVDIEVRESNLNRFLDFFNTELFTIPFGITGSVTGEGEGEGITVTLGGLLLVMIIGFALYLLFRRFVF